MTRESGDAELAYELLRRLVNLDVYDGMGFRSYQDGRFDVDCTIEISESEREMLRRLDAQ